MYKKHLALNKCSIHVGCFHLTPRGLIYSLAPTRLSLFCLCIFFQPRCPWLPCPCYHLHLWKLPCIFLVSFPSESFHEALFDHDGFSHLWTHEVFIFCGEIGGRNPEDPKIFPLWPLLDLVEMKESGNSVQKELHLMWLGDSPLGNCSLGVSQWTVVWRGHLPFQKSTPWCLIQECFITENGQFFSFINWGTNQAGGPLDTSADVHMSSGCFRLSVGLTPAAPTPIRFRWDWSVPLYKLWTVLKSTGEDTASHREPSWALLCGSQLTPLLFPKPTIIFPASCFPSTWDILFKVLYLMNPTHDLKSSSEVALYEEPHHQPLQTEFITQFSHQSFIVGLFT